MSTTMQKFIRISRKQKLINELEARIRGVELTCNCGVIEHYFISLWKSRIEKIKML